MSLKKNERLDAQEPKLPTLADAQANLDRNSADRERLAGELERLRIQVTSERDQLGEAFLVGDETGIRKLQDLEGRVLAITSAITVLDQRRPLLEVGLKRATAVDLRQLAAAKTAELETLRRATGELLAKLSAIEGVEYDHAILQAQRAGSWFVLPHFGSGNADSYCQPDDVGREPVGANAGVYLSSKSRRLHQEISRLLDQAEMIENDLAVASGTVVELPTKPVEKKGATLYGEEINPRSFSHRS